MLACQHRPIFRGLLERKRNVAICMLIQLRLIPIAIQTHINFDVTCLFLL